LHWYQQSATTVPAHLGGTAAHLLVSRPDQARSFETSSGGKATKPPIYPPVETRRQQVTIEQ
jgi:hypothetical protein